MEKIIVEICTGTACFVMGSGKLLSIEESLPANIRDYVEVQPVLCCGLCRDWTNSKPPVVSVAGKMIAGADEEKIIKAVMAALEGGNLC
ncbi:MAG: hypothetical protein JXR86_19560 [Spirochaetales bacterium]|nr:hypothetical protein [Spirochaetales bacterium]